MAHYKIRGPPSAEDSLLYDRFHCVHGIESVEVEAVLSVLKSFISSEKLQRIPESQRNYPVVLQVELKNFSKNYEKRGSSTL